MTLEEYKSNIGNSKQPQIKQIFFDIFSKAFFNQFFFKIFYEPTIKSHRDEPLA